MSKHKDRQTSRIFNATFKMIEEHGISGLTMSGIADTASMTRQTVYNYFPDVESILAGALQAHAQAVELQVLDLLASVDGVREKLRKLTAFQIELASAEHSSISFEAGLSSDGRAQLEAHGNAIRAAIGAVIRSGQRTGEVAPGLDDAVVADLIWAIIEAVAETTARRPRAKPYLREAAMAAIYAILAGVGDHGGQAQS